MIMHIDVTEVTLTMLSIDMSANKDITKHVKLI